MSAQNPRKYSLAFFSPESDIRRHDYDFRCRHGADTTRAGDGSHARQRSPSELSTQRRGKGRNLPCRDADVKGFVLVVTPAGARSYAVDYRAGSGRGSPKRRLTIGKHGSPWTPEAARTEAKRLLAEVAAGRDPATARREVRKAITFGELIDIYLSGGRGSQEGLDPQSRSRAHRTSLATAAQESAGRSHRSRRCRADAQLRLRPARLPRRLGRGEKRRPGSVATGGEGTAAQCVALVSTIFAFGVERGLCSDNPARGVKKAPVRKVGRFLSEGGNRQVGRGSRRRSRAIRQPLPIGGDQALCC